MKYELHIAWRFFKARKANNFISRISVIAVIIIALAVLIPMVTISVLNGFHESLIGKYINRNYHIQIKKSYSNEYQGNNNYFTEYQDVIKDIQKSDLMNKIKWIDPFCHGHILIQHEDSQIKGVQLRGAGQKYLTGSSFQKHFPIIAGPHNLHRKFDIIIGERLAQLLNPSREAYKDFLKRVDSKRNVPRVRVLIPKTSDDAETNTIQSKELRVIGVFKSGYVEYDQYLTFVALPTAQLLFSKRLNPSDPYYVDGLGIKLYDRRDAKKIKNQLMSLLVEDYKSYPRLRIKTWEAFSKNLLHAFNWEKQLLTLILVIMIVASVIITIYINLNIVVMDKKKEIGILKSFGVANKSIRRIFIAEGFLISLIGSLLGSVLSMLLLSSLIDIIKYIESITNHIMAWGHGIFDSQTPYIPWVFFSGGLSHIKVMLYQVDEIVIFNFNISIDLLGLSVLSIFVSMLAAYFPARKSTQENITSVIRYE